jgi:nitrite reductase/ring-hydroxylating ferredoxin subunit
MKRDWTKTIRHDALAAKGRAVLRRDGKQIVLFLSSDGVVYACNNRCPHEGYPLREGTLDDGCTLTCDWHNWKFDLKTGANHFGGDALRVYPVEVRDGDIWLDLSDPPLEARRAAIMANLRNAFDDHEYDRIAREIARLRLADPENSDATEAVVAAIEWSFERFEFGWTHAYGGTADWLALHDEQAGDPEAQLVCLLECVGHMADDALPEERYPFTGESRPYDEDGFVAALEDEDEDLAVAHLRGALDGGLGFAGIERGLCRAALAHYAGFGHSLIYTVKAGRLIERLGERVAAPLLLSLTRSLIYSRREDRIPEFRHYAQSLAAWGRGKAASAALRPGDFAGLNAKNAMKLTARHGAAPSADLYGALLAANATNMLRYDMAYQTHIARPIRDNVGWLDFTHAITFANAVRRTCAKHPELWPSGLLQMACFSGRNAAYTDADLDDDQWLIEDPISFFEGAVQSLFDHGRDEYIVSVHYLKTLLAAREELRADPAGAAARPLLAALNRLLNSTLKRKHTRRTAHQAMKFVALDG